MASNTSREEESCRQRSTNEIACTSEIAAWNQGVLFGTSLQRGNRSWLENNKYCQPRVDVVGEGFEDPEDPDTEAGSPWLVEICPEFPRTVVLVILSC